MDERNALRVLHVISGIDPRNGGPTAALLGLVRAQVRAGLRVAVASTWKDPDAHTSADRLREYGAEPHLIGPARGKLSRHPDLVATVDRLVGQADVVHTHAMWEEIQHQACRSAQRQGVPYVMTPHGMLDPWNMGKNRWGKRLYLGLRMRRNLDRAAAVHFTTEIERDWVARLGLRSPALLEPLGLDWSEFETLPAAGSFRGRYPEVAGRPLVVFLGRQHAGKGLEVLVPAMERVRPADAVLAVVGPDSGGFQREVEAMVRRHGLEGRVIFTGMLRGADRVAALVDADVMALPSYHENFGIAVMEAMAAGTPVVVSDQVNLHPEVTASGVGGVVPMDVGSLSAELTRWLGDEAMRRAAGARGRSLARTRYNWDDIAGRWVGHYAKAVAARRRGVAVPGAGG
jgi:glycosyltransferase involved in cell wall biosynthesis